MKRRIVSRVRRVAKTATLKSVTLSARIVLGLECGHSKMYLAGRAPKGDYTVCKKCEREAGR